MPFPGLAARPSSKRLHGTIPIADGGTNSRDHPPRSDLLGIEQHGLAKGGLGRIHVAHHQGSTADRQMRLGEIRLGGERGLPLADRGAPVLLDGVGQAGDGRTEKAAGSRHAHRAALIVQERHQSLDAIHRRGTALQLHRRRPHQGIGIGQQIDAVRGDRLVGDLG